MGDIVTRMGDGQRVAMSPAEVKEDLLAGTKDAADKGRVPELSSAELDHLFEIIVDKNQAVSVQPEERVVLTDDITVIRCLEDEGAGGGVGMPMSRMLADLVHERVLAQDSAVFENTAAINIMEIKNEIDVETQAYETTSLLMTIPLIYTVAPALLWYFYPSGPYGNPSDLLPQGKIKEAREGSEKAAEHLKNDLIFIGKRLNAVGCDCWNLDTTAAGGDPEFYAALEAVQELKQVAPNMGIEMGMAGEFIIGVHGQMTFNGQRLAGMFPHEQVKVAEAAGVDIFGPVVNTNCSKSFPWNIARSVTFVKETVAESNIPVHANAGMGVCSIPMRTTPPIDSVTRMAKAMVQVGNVDGL